MVIVIGVTALTSAARADVSYKNGNFFIAFDDVTLSGGLELKVARTYNSKSSADGMFGFGWGSDYEVSLTVMGDGTIVVHENGGGAQNMFVPEHYDPAQLEHCVGEMVAAAAEVHYLEPGELPDWRTRLLRDARFRHDEWLILDRKKRLSRPEIAAGTVFVSDKYGRQTIRRSQDGYVRELASRVERFDRDGHLAQLTDANGNWIRFTSDEHGRFTRLEDNLGQWIELSYGAGDVRRVALAKASTGAEVEYTYNGNELIRASTKGGSDDRYSWSKDGRHNLTKIDYNDGTSMQIRYNPFDRSETVSSVIDRDGMMTAYTYSGSLTAVSLNDTTFGTFVELASPDGSLESVQTYRYVQRTTEIGASYIASLRTDIDGDETVTEYNQCCGLPLRIEHGGEVTTFEYDDRGKVTHKKTPTEETWLQYEPRSGKVSRVDHRGEDDAHVWFAYHYDDRGNLSYGEDSRGRQVWVAYDDHGRIASIKGPEQKTLHFEYNQHGRPERITVDGVGSLTVTYKATGEIQKLDSNGGHDIALSINATYQQLLDIVQPAGVSLSF